MRRSQGFLAASLLLAAACGDGSGMAESRPGALTGTVELLGPVTNPPASGELRVYGSPGDLELERAFRRVPLAGQGAN